MYVHRRCKPSGAELDREKKAGGFCASCGQEGTIFYVTGTDDWYQHILNGILYTVSKGIETTPMTAVWARERINLAKVKAARKGENWTETPVEAESTEEIEAVEEAIEEAVEAEIEAAVPEEKEPEETVVEAEPEASEEEAKNADIARLEAELAELKR